MYSVLRYIFKAVLGAFARRAPHPGRLPARRRHVARAARAPQEPVIICVLGAPGVGKGTQCARLLDRFSPRLTTLSYGDTLRAQARLPGSDVSRLPSRPGETSRLVPDYLAARIMRDAVLGPVAATRSRNHNGDDDDDDYDGDDSAHTDKGKKMVWLLDGFPRCEGQMRAWEELGMPTPKLVLNLTCPANTSAARIRSRAAGSGRPDDASPELAARRISRFTDAIGPVLEAYRDRGLVAEVATDRDRDAVSWEMHGLVKKVLDE